MTNTLNQDQLINAQHLSVSYVSGQPALSDVNLTVQKGEFILVIGANGSGKSTLLKTLAGIIDDYSGKLERHASPGYLAQQSDADAHFPASVSEVVAAASLVGSARHQQEAKRTERALADMNITDLKNCYFGDLSGGQRQKVLIARALATHSNLLILDEPTNHLDPASVTRLINLLSRLHTAGATLIISSHDVAKLAPLADRTLVLESGHLQADNHLHKAKKAKE